MYSGPVQERTRIIVRSKFTCGMSRPQMERKWKMPFRHKKSFLALTSETFPRLSPRDQSFLCFKPGKWCRCVLAQSSVKTGGKVSFYFPGCGDLKGTTLLSSVNDKYIISSENQIKVNWEGL